jgi:hypothetical protein
MSGLSARTYSWGGEGSRFGRGGEASLTFDAAGGGALGKNFNIPSFLVNWRLLSSSEGTEDSSEESSELILVVVLVEGGRSRWVGIWSQKEALAINESTSIENVIGLGQNSANAHNGQMSWILKGSILS